MVDEISIVHNDNNVLFRHPKTLDMFYTYSRHPKLAIHLDCEINKTLYAMSLMCMKRTRKLDWVLKPQKIGLGVMMMTMLSITTHFRTPKPTPVPLFVKVRVAYHCK